MTATIGICPTGMTDPLHWAATDPDVLWATGNVSEAIPGVSSALNWSFIDDAIESAVRRAFHTMGLLRSDELALGARAEDRFMVCFYGRTVANIEAMRRIGDRTPGTSGNALEKQLFGVLRSGVADHPDRSRLAAAAIRMPWMLARLPKRQARHSADVLAWWRRAAVEPPAELADARALLAQARRLYSRSFELSTLASMVAQALYDRVVELAVGTGREGLEHRLITGYATILETGMLSELWDLARGFGDVTSFLLRHGYHGPDEGQLDSRVWREDPAPLLTRLPGYAGLDDGAHPREVLRRRAAVREDAEAEFRDALPPSRRAAASTLLRLARIYLPQREIGKSNYTRSLDGARIAARGLGRAFARAEMLADADDVFGLTYDEVTSPSLPADAHQRAAQRAALRRDYATTTLADRWTGPPARIPLTTSTMAVHSVGVETIISGEACGGGVATGHVRVVDDPADVDLEPGDVLVCRSTDPSWSLLFPLASALVVDLGGRISHTAIVARELGLPCVGCTGDGTIRLHTGDLVHVDGDRGIVEVLSRSEGQP